MLINLSCGAMRLTVHVADYTYKAFYLFSYPVAGLCG